MIKENPNQLEASNESLEQTNKELNNLKNEVMETNNSKTGISEAMFQEILKMEGDQGLEAGVGKEFGEDFATGPYGMVYKRIDEYGNPLPEIKAFEKGDRVTKEWAVENARTCYKKLADYRKGRLGKYNYTQDMLDALVCKSGGTRPSTIALKNYALKNWKNKKSIAQYISKHAITDQNKRVQPGLVKRAKFASNWFLGDKKPFSSY